MPSIKTITTELAVAVGILGYEQVETISANEILPQFDGSVSTEDFSAFQYEFLHNKRNQRLYHRMHQVGVLLRKNEPALSKTNLITWIGPESQARTTTMARDLQAGYIAISVKAESNVIANPSPFNLIQAFPSGEPPIRRSGNWYHKVGANVYQELFEVANSIVGQDLSVPTNVGEYDTKTKQKLRKQFGKNLSEKMDQAHELTSAYLDVYRRFSQTIAQTSSDLFNKNLKKSLSSPRAAAVIETLAQRFLRLGGAPYILAGVDGNNPFAVRIPDITSWQRTWQISIKALPDLNSLQPVVLFTWEAVNKTTREQYIIPFHAEVRWSHGRFCGNPEGKLYKDFKWTELPFFESIF